MLEKMAGSSISGYTARHSEQQNPHPHCNLSQALSNLLHIEQYEQQHYTNWWDQRGIECTQPTKAIPLHSSSLVRLYSCRIIISLLPYSGEEIQSVPVPTTGIRTTGTLNQLI